MQIMIDTANDTPKVIAHYMTYLAAAALALDDLSTATINETGPVAFPDLKPDFAPEDNVPADAFEFGKKAEFNGDNHHVPAAPLPPNLPPVANIAPGTNWPSNVVALAPMPPPTVPAAPSPDVDSAGVTYDSTLHSSTRALTIDGKWRARRKVEKAAAPLPPNLPPPLPVPAVTPPVELVAEVALTPLMPTLLPYQAPAALPPNVAPVEVAPIPPPPFVIDFPTFISRVTAGSNAGTVTQVAIDAALKAHGVANLWSLNTSPDKLGPVASALGLNNA